MSSVVRSLTETPLLRLMADNDELVAVHAIVSASRLMDGAGLAAAYPVSKMMIDKLRVL